MGDKPGVRFVCPHCGKRLRVALVYAGRRVPCPNPGCRVPVDVPGDDPVGELPAPSPDRPEPATDRPTEPAVDLGRLAGSVWAEVAATAALLAAAAGRAGGHAALLTRRQRLRARLAREKVWLGEAAAAAGAGDEAARRPVAELDDRIRQLRAAGAATAGPAAERAAALVRLADHVVEQPPDGPGVEAPLAAVRATAAELADVGDRLAASRAALVPAARDARGRLAAGLLAAVTLVAAAGHLGYRAAAAGARPIASVADEGALQGAVGLVVCGVRLTDAGGTVREYSRVIGTAFAVSPDGVMVTNRHVVEEAVRLRTDRAARDRFRALGFELEPAVWVYFGRARRHPAEVRYVSDRADVAVLAVDRSFDRVFALRAAPAVARGVPVFALGYPAVAGDGLTAGEMLEEEARRQRAGARADDEFLDKQFDFVLTSGRVGRMTEMSGQAWVQHEAAIHPGNSGGPLVTEDGVAVGINTLKHAQAAGLSYAIAVASVRAELAPYLGPAVWR